MTLQEIQLTCRNITSFLAKKEVKNAFDMLQTLIVRSKGYMYQDQLNELKATYTYMLKYRIDGIKDPMQEQIYNQLLISSFELADHIKQHALALESPNPFYSNRRKMKKRSQQTFKQLHTRLNGASGPEGAAEQEQAEIDLFNKIWGSSLLRQEEVFEIQEIFNDHSLPQSVKCQIVSALLLALQEVFDKEKIQLLFDATAHPDEEVHIRALIALLISLFNYPPSRISLFPVITDRMDALLKTPGMIETVRMIILRFILAQATERITHQLQHEIIPEMIKLQFKDKLGRKDQTFEQTGEGMNPEWKNLITDSRLGKKLEELNELQMEGADIMHASISHLKHFPFFKETANWFLPFSSTHSLLKGKLADSQLLEAMLSSLFVCNSDRYSLCFSIMQMSNEARKEMINQFDGQAQEMLRLKQEELRSRHNRQELIAGQYVQDLYRFFKVHPDRFYFDDIFDESLDFHHMQLLMPYMSNEENLTIIAEYYLQKKFFTEALTEFRRLSQIRSDNHVVFQKMGYCLQMQENEDIEGALEAYLRADLLHPESTWTIRKIATCYRSLNKLEEALPYYRRYEALRPDDLSVQAAIGHCYLALKEYNEALKYFFKIDYLDADGHKAWRPIAWCSFLTGKYDQARNYYKKILGDRPTTQDFINAGHTEWALQNMREALNCYRQAVASEQGDFTKFQELFDEDVQELTMAGIEEEEIPLMMDQLSYLIDGVL